MDSTKKLYEELLKEHPELKNSEKDIQQAIGYLQESNPNITVDEIFKQDLKENVLHVANYNPIKSQGKISWLLYLVPTMSFGFAIFGFMYFSEEFQPEKQLEITEVALTNQELSLPKISEITSQSDDNQSEIGTTQFKIKKSDDSFSMSISKQTEKALLPNEESPEPVKIKSPENRDIQNLKSEKMFIPENTSTDDIHVVEDNDDQINEREMAPAGIMMDQMSIETFSDDGEDDSIGISVTEDLEDNSILEVLGDISEKEISEEAKSDFEAFCEEQKGEFVLGENGAQLCEKDQETCSEKEHKNGECFDSKLGE
ncbi:MAG: hypothetical protein GY828_06130 [Candidatus Gracilibacteria bacterium]|nr:hypothetical protein [Candidatus Gracilibacteria bacterium]